MSRYDAGVAKPVQAFLSDWLVLCRTEKKLTLGFLVINELEFWNGALHRKLHWTFTSWS